jgi:hypothetical protein
MNDYTPRARAYWWTVAVIGYALLAYGAYVTARLPPDALRQVALCAAFAGAVAIFPVRIPGATVSLACGEIFIFFALFLFGAEAAVLAAAFEGAVGSARTSRRWTSWFGSPAMAAIAVGASGLPFAAARASLDRQGLLTGPTMILLITALAVVYCALNILLPSLLLALKRGERLDVAGTLKDGSWMLVAHFGSAALAANLFYYGAIVNVWLLLASLPAVGLLVWSARCVVARTGRGREAAPPASPDRPVTAGGSPPRKGA